MYLVAGRTADACVTAIPTDRCVVWPQHRDYVTDAEAEAQRGYAPFFVFCRDFLDKRRRIWYNESVYFLSAIRTGRVVADTALARHPVCQRPRPVGGVGRNRLDGQYLAVTPIIT